MHSAASGTSTARESRIGFPMSSVSSRASSSRCSRISSAKRTSTRLRFFGAMRDHTPDSNAARAPRTARSTSSASQAATDAIVRPVAGLTQSNVSPDIASTYAPSTKACERMERSVRTSSTVWVMVFLLQGRDRQSRQYGLLRRAAAARGLLRRRRGPWCA